MSWLKEGQTVDPTQVTIRNTDCDSIIFIRKAERKHSGKYDMKVEVENHVDTAIIDIQIVGGSRDTDRKDILISQLKLFRHRTIKYLYRPFLQIESNRK